MFLPPSALRISTFLIAPLPAALGVFHRSRHRVSFARLFRHTVRHASDADHQHLALAAMPYAATNGPVNPFRDAAVASRCCRGAVLFSHRKRLSRLQLIDAKFGFGEAPRAPSRDRLKIQHLLRVSADSSFQNPSDLRQFVTPARGSLPPCCTIWANQEARNKRDTSLLHYFTKFWLL